MKTALVTGGAGFVGSHLCERLQASGYTVISLDNYFTGSKSNHVPGVQYREGHTKDIERLVPEHVDIVFHLGEYARVEKSFEDVEQVWDLNKLGTFAVLEYVRRRGCKIVYAGSSTKFGDGGLGRDQSPYAWSKATNTELVRNYGAWFGVPFAITYFYNVYGPRERAGSLGTLIEIFRQNRLNGKPLTVVSPGTQRRNFTHVDDIVDGLMLVGEKGEGDEYGIGARESYSILEVAEMYGGEIVLLPERQGNRTQSDVDTSRVEALGWTQKRKLSEYIHSCMSEIGIVAEKEKRVLVFTTTFHPTAGPAEDALCELMHKLPDVQFDIVTTAYSASVKGSDCPVQNATVHRVGFGTRLDKLLLPFLGATTASKLLSNHSYLFMWSLMASYGALAAVWAKRDKQTPLLVTLADQQISWYQKLLVRILLRGADQIYASLPEQGTKLGSLQQRMQAQTSLGEGDSFANTVRFAYSDVLRKTVLEKTK